jgi:hypothetical protein
MPAVIYTIKGYIEQANKVMSQKNVWWVDLVKVVVLISAVGVVVLTASSIASTGDESVDLSVAKNFSAIGSVSDISGTSLTLFDAQGSGIEQQSTYTLDLAPLGKIEDRTYTPLQLENIKPGARVIVQGIKNGDSIGIFRIILLSPPFIIDSSDTSTTGDQSEATGTTTATTTATTTDIGDVSTTTQADASVTASSTEVSTSTPPAEENATTTTATTTDTNSPMNDDSVGSGSAEVAPETPQTPLE